RRNAARQGDENRSGRTGKKRWRERHKRGGLVGGVKTPQSL
ncbi:uncharacterized protein METZ01_LOCUS484101, partial [marine metagenome]